MANLLTEQDTFFGTIAFRNKLISREQLGQAVLLVQTTHARIRLGEALVRTGALTPRQVETILEMQQQQREVIKQQEETPPPEEKPSTPISDDIPEERESDTSVGKPEDTLPPGKVVYRIPAETAAPTEPLPGAPESPAEISVAVVAEEEPVLTQPETPPPARPEETLVAPAPPPAPELPVAEDEDLKIERLSEVDVSGARGESSKTGIQLERTAGVDDDEMLIERRPILESIEVLKPALESLDVEVPEPLPLAQPASVAEEGKPEVVPPPLPTQRTAQRASEDDSTFSSMFSMPELLPGDVSSQGVEELAEGSAPQPSPESLSEPVSTPDVAQRAEPPHPAAPPSPEPILPVAVTEPTPSVPEVAATKGPLFDLLREVRAMGASDLHISAEVRPFVRKFGGITPLDRPVLSARETEKMLFSALTNRQKLTLLADKGLEFCLNIEGEGRYRATIVKQRCGWDGIFRVVRLRVPTVQDLGLPESVARLTEYHQGLVLVTGPGNSGKTTTLAALVDAVNRSRNDHIITLEQPIEYVHEARECQVTQREIGPHSESFAAALRGALREDPDVIMVGELRDTETLSMAISASETGHLVLGTLHTTSAASTVGRVVDAFPVGQQQQIRMMLSESMRGILSQRLVPRKDGQGVVLALEILFVNSAVSALIRDNKPFQLPSIMQTARKLGMQRMEDALLDLLNQDLIEGANAYRLASNKQPFEAWNPAKAAAR
jgi:twitching motility protein PilT